MAAAHGMASISMTTSSEEENDNNHAAPPRRRLAPSRRSTGTATGASANNGTTTTTTTTAVTPSGRIVVLPSTGSSRPASRSGSPARRQLRSLPSVPAVSNLEVHSDKLVRLEEDLAFINDQLLLQQQRQQQQRQRRANGEQEEALAANGAAVEEDTGKAKELALPSTKPVATVTYAEEPLIQAGISDYTFIPLDAGGLLGKGKFSSVQLAWKNGQKFAVKITPLYPHHTLIATRLLREPTILAQLPLHPNLVRVYESIRTPAYFYLVEEFLDGYTSLEAFVASQPNSRLSLDAATHVFKQLVSVVRSGLHQPIQIAHRDIKPENILIHPETLHITLLDFGLATHFSWRQPKLTTCCGSPAFHAPELYLSLKSPPGSVRYWGPEIDIWTIGVTLLRCLTGTKYPLGVSHTSLQHMADKTVDSLLSIPHADFRRTLAGLLDMDGDKRIAFFAALPADIDEYPHTLDTKHIHVTNFDGPAHAPGSTPAAAQASGDKDKDKDKDKEASDGREFKNTTFIQTQPKHSLQMPLISHPQSPAMSPNASASALTALTAPLAGPTPTAPGAAPHALLASPRSRSQSRDRLAAHFAAGLDLSLHDLPSAAAATAPGSNGASAAGAPTPVALAHQQSFTSPAAASKQTRPSYSRGPSTYSPHASALAIAASQELLLLNPSGEPAKRAISFVKYALRCAGILYHVQPHPPVRPAPATQSQSQSESRPGTSSGDAAIAVGEDLPSAEAPRMHLCAPVLHCIQVLPKEAVHPSSAAASLLNSQLRPALSRSQTAGSSSSASARSPSAPPGSTAAKRKAEAAAAAAKLRVLEFWIQIVPVYAVVRHSPVTERKALAGTNGSAAGGGATGGNKRRGTSRSRGREPEERRCSKLRVRVSDEAAVPFLIKALEVGKLSEEESAAEPEAQAQAPSAMQQKAGAGSRRKGVAFAGVEKPADASAASDEDAADDEGRGRPKLSRSPQASGLVAASSGKEGASGLDSAIKDAARPTIKRAMTEASAAVVQPEQLPMASPTPTPSPLPTPQALSSGSVNGKDASTSMAQKHKQKQRRGPAPFQRQQSVSSPSTGGSSASVLTGSSSSGSKRGFFDIVTSSFSNGGSRPRRIASAEPPYSNLNSPCITESPAESMPNTPNAVAFAAL